MPFNLSPCDAGCLGLCAFVVLSFLSLVVKGGR